MDPICSAISYLLESPVYPRGNYLTTQGFRFGTAQRVSSHELPSFVLQSTMNSYLFPSPAQLVDQKYQARLQAANQLIENVEFTGRSLPHRVTLIEVVFYDRGFLARDVTPAQWKKLPPLDKLAHSVVSNAIVKGINIYMSVPYESNQFGTPESVMTLSLLNYCETTSQRVFTNLIEALSGPIWIHLQDLSFLVNNLDWLLSPSRFTIMDSTSIYRFSDRFKVKHYPSLPTMYQYTQHGIVLVEQEPTPALELIAGNIPGLVERVKASGCPCGHSCPRCKPEVIFAQGLTDSIATSIGASLKETVQPAVDSVLELASDIRATSTTTRQVVASFNKTSESVEVSLTKIDGLVDRVSSYLDSGTAAILKATATSLVSYFQDVPTMLVRLVRVLDVFHDLFNGGFKHVKNQLARTVKVLYRIIQALDLDHVFVNFTADNAGDYYHRLLAKIIVPPDHIQAQADDTSKSFAELLVAFVGSAAMGAMATEKQIKRVSETMLFQQRLTNTVSSAKTFFIKALEFLPNCMQAWIREWFPADFFTEHITSGEYAKWATEVEEFMMQYTLNDILFDNVKVDKLFEMERRGRELYLSGATKIESAKGTKWYTHVQNLSTRIMKLAESVREVRRNEHDRDEPFVLWLEGAPGVGKSVLTDSLAAALAPQDIKPEALKYARNAATKYWDGYRGQYCVFMDDVQQIPDAETALEFVCLVSNVAYPLPMASLSDAAIGKKGTLFTSKVLIATSNDAYPEVAGQMTNKKAFWRRRHVLARVKAPMNGEIGDKSQFKEDGSHLAFDILHPTVPGRVIKGNLPLVEFLKFVLTKRDEHEVNQRNRRDANLSILAQAKRARFMVDIEAAKRRDDAEAFKTLSERAKEFAMQEMPDIAANWHLEQEFQDAAWAENIKAQGGETYPSCLPARYFINGQFLNPFYADALRLVDECRRSNRPVPNMTEFSDDAFEAWIGKTETELKDRSWIRRNYEHLVAEVRAYTNDFKRSDATGKMIIVGFTFASACGFVLLIVGACKIAKYLYEKYKTWRADTRKQRIKLRAEGAYQEMNRLHQKLIDSEPDPSKRAAFLKIFGTLERYTSQLDALVSQPDAKRTELLARQMANELREIDLTKAESMGSSRAHRRDENVERVQKRHAASHKILQQDPETGKWFYSRAEGGGMRYNENVRKTDNTKRSASINTNWRQPVKSEACIITNNIEKEGVFVAWDTKYEDGMTYIVLPKNWKETTEFLTTKENFYSESIVLSNPEEKSAWICKTGEHDPNKQYIILPNDWKQKIAFVSVEGSNDVAAMKFADEDLVKNLVEVKVSPVGQPAQRMHGVMIDKTKLLAPRHLFYTAQGLIPTDTIIEITTITGTTHQCGFHMVDFVEMADGNGNPKDFAIYDMGIRVPPFKSRVDSFIKESDLPELQYFNGVLVSMNIREGVPHVRKVTLPHIRPLEQSIQYYTQEETEYKLVSGWEYQADTTFGDCGAVLVLNKPTITRKLAGIHVAGSQRRNFAQVVVQEDLRHALKELQARMEIGSAHGERVMVESLPESGMQKLGDMLNAIAAPSGTSFTPLGTALPGTLPRVADKTQLIPSPIHGVYPVLTEPAALSPTDPRIDQDLRDAGFSMIQAGVDKYCQPNRPMKRDVLIRAKNYVNETLKKLIMRKGPLRNLSEHEAINGIPGESFLMAMDFTTSPGLPYVMSRPNGIKGKGYLFSGVPGNRQIADVELRKELNETIENGKKGVRIGRTWISTLKDEKRLIAKIKRGKTRVFTIGNVVFTLVGRQYFLDFCARFYEARLQCPSAVGITPEGPDWQTLYDSLARISDEGFDGDFSNYDGTLQAEAMWGLLELINSCYSDEFSLLRQVIFHEMIHTEVTCLNMLLYKHQGNPSGCFMTVIINTYVNWIYMTYCWLELAPLELRDPYFMPLYTNMFIYGDDNIVVAKRSVQGWFNQTEISRVLAECGLTYTAADKLAKNQGFKHLSELKFLKRGFRVLGRQILPLMESTTMTELLNWVRKSANDWISLEVNAHSALTFAFFYGPEFYNTMRNTILTAVGKHPEADPNFALPSFAFFNGFFGNKQCLPALQLVNGIPTYTEQRVPTSPEDRIYAQSAIEKEITDTAETKTSTITDPILGEPGSTKVASNTHGFTETQETATTTTETAGGTSSGPRAHNFVPDIQWDLVKMVEKWTFVGTFDWNTSQPMNTILAPSYRAVPQDFWSSNFNHAPFQLFTYWRGSMVVKLQVNGTPFHQGRVIAYFVPLTPPDRIAEWHALSSCARTTVPHVQLNPTISNSVELKIPFTNPNHVLYLSETDPNKVKLMMNYLGTFTIQVQNKLVAAAAAAQSLRITMHVKFVDNFWAVPRPESICQTTLRTVQDKIRAQGLLDSVAKSLPNFSSVLRKIVGPLEVSDAISLVTTMDKPTNSENPQLFVPNKLGFYSHGTNIEPTERFHLTPNTFDHATHETFATDNDEMNIKYLTSIWNLDNIVNWPTSFQAGKIIGCDYICPMSAALDRTQPNMMPLMNNRYDSGQGVWANMRDYVSMKFSFWKGTLKYKIQVIDTAYHGGRLAFTVHYGIFRTSDIPADLSARMSQYTVILDVGQSNNEWEIEVPYYAPRLLKVPNGRWIQDFPTLDDEVYDSYCCGLWCLSVVNPLVAPAEVPNNVDINIWVAGGHDYDLSYIGSNNSTIRPVNYQEQRIMAQGDRIPGATPRPVRPVVENNTPMLHISDEHALVAAPKAAGVLRYRMDKIDSIGDIIKRYARCYTWTYAQEPSQTTDFKYKSWAFDIGYLVFGAYPNPAPGVGNSAVWGANGLLTWFSKMYRGYHGSLRFKFDTLNTGVNPRITIAYEPQTMYKAENVQTCTHSGEMQWRLDRWMSEIVPGANRNHDGAGTFVRQAMISPPKSVSMGIEAYQPIEIPYVSSMKFLMVPDDDKEETGILGTPYSSQGTLLYAITFVNNETQVGSQSTYSGIDPLFSIEAAAGDDFRFGILIGPPYVYVEAVPVFPDNYYSAA